MMKKNLKFFKLLFLAVLVLTNFWKCADSKFSDPTIEKKALEISEQLDEKTINIFNDWGFSKRGKIEIWAKNEKDSISYGFLYFKGDTIKFTLFGIDAFRKDYPFNAPADLSQYYTVDFSKTKNAKVSIAGTNKNAVRDTIVKDIPENELFTSKNPFEKLKELSDFANDLGILNTFHKPDLGNFIEFYLTSEYVLTYLPEYLFIDPKHKDKILKDLETGKQIRKNWNLRQLEKPVDIN